MRAYRPSLKVMLTVPYLVLVLVAMGIIGTVVYRAAREAVDNLSGQLLRETVNRVAQAVQSHVSVSEDVLEVAFPKGIAAPASIEQALPALRTRFWLATSVHRDPNNYAYYGDQRGHFFGLWRDSETQAELRLRFSDQGPRHIRRFTGMAGEPEPAAWEARVFEPRERPWYRAGQSQSGAAWTPVYIDFKTSELVTTKVKSVNNPAGEFAGVVATDLSLRNVNEFLKRLPLSRRGLALVVEADGQLIGASRGPNLRPLPDGKQQRLNAAQSTDPMVVAAYAAAVRLAGPKPTQTPRTGVFEGPGGHLVQLGYAHMPSESGLNWLIMVAVPRSDFLGVIEDRFSHTVAVAALVALAVMGLGLVVLAAVTRELRGLSAAVARVAGGNYAQPLSSDRRDELGLLANSFGDMQRRLMTDHLTGLANREAVLRRMEERILQHRRRGDGRPFAVLFADLNSFKRINDQFGHEKGDEVLRELALRLRAKVRTGDLVARYAGDEFVILLDEVDDRQAAMSARSNLEAVLAEPLQSLAALDADAANAGGACGLALYPNDGQDVESLVRHADADMYARKPNAQPRDRLPNLDR
jgi:diguanylate cyclase (GGDEF)-like protein